MPSEIEDPESASTFYDHLAAEYHLMFADWRGSVRRQGRILDTLIRRELGEVRSSILDCTCGIGTQAIGLALSGHTVRGTDASPESIRRAEREADSFGVSVEFEVADLLALNTQVGGSFDLVISCDNSLPHLLHDSDLEMAGHNIRTKLKPNGVFLASIRDYDEIIKTCPKSTAPQVFDDAEGRRIVFQVWDWLEDERNYVFHLFILRSLGGAWTVSSHSARYRAVRRVELTDILLRVGFSDVHWMMPDETGFYQPIVMAHG